MRREIDKRIGSSAVFGSVGDGWCRDQALESSSVLWRGLLVVVTLGSGVAGARG